MTYCIQASVVAGAFSLRAGICEIMLANVGLDKLRLMKIRRSLFYPSAVIPSPAIIACAEEILELKQSIDRILIIDPGLTNRLILNNDMNKKAPTT